MKDYRRVILEGEVVHDFAEGWRIVDDDENEWYGQVMELIQEFNGRMVRLTIEDLELVDD